MLQRGNTKLGTRIWCWSLPAKETCPFISEICGKVCYAARARFKTTDVLKSLTLNYKAARSPHFVSWMLMQLELYCPSAVRIHVSGDFFDEGYIAKWVEVIEQSPDSTFYMYTRAWVCPELAAPLQRLAELPNVRMWWSTDKSMPAPPENESVKTCYLSLNDDDTPNYLVDLVFRNHPKTPARRVGSLKHFVCPAEQKVERSEGKMTCDRCRVCFASPKENHATRFPARQEVVTGMSG